MQYKRLETESLVQKISRAKNKITAGQIKTALNWCHNNYSFSTYSYCNLKKSKNGKLPQQMSRNIVRKTHTGNCIGMCYGLKDLLRKKYSAKSYIIPATVPDSFKKPGYLDISHVALMIPGPRPWLFYIADPAFYFLKPIRVDMRNWTVPGICEMSNIYSSNIPNKVRFFTRPRILNKVNKLNKYQTIDKHTPVVYCSDYTGWEFTEKEPNINHYGVLGSPGGTGHSGLSWNYFVTEIKNPDIAITTFFQKIWKDSPFITRTKMRRGSVVCPVSIHQRKDGKITIKEYNVPRYHGLARDLTPEQLKYYEKLFNLKYIRGKKWENYLIKNEKCNF